jgi:hypothetical protein
MRDLLFITVVALVIINCFDDISATIYPFIYHHTFVLSSLTATSIISYTFLTISPHYLFIYQPIAINNKTSLTYYPHSY